MNKIVHIAMLLVLPAITHADVSPPRLVLDASTIASGEAVPVRSDVGLAGFVAGGAVPASDTTVDSSSKCTHGRRGSTMSWASGAEWIGSTAEIVAIAGHEYLDEGELANNGNDRIKVSTHTRRPITRIATLGDEAIAWAYRQNGTIVIGAFADFGEMNRMTTLGCRWLTFTIAERGGSGSTVSRPSFSDPKTYGLPAARDKPRGPSFSIAASASRSSSDASALLVVRASLLPEDAR